MALFAAILLQLSDADRARELIAQLGSESPEKREAAFDELASMGPGIGGVLEEFAEAPDPEVRARVGELLERVRRMVDRARWFAPVRRVTVHAEEAPVGGVIAEVVEQTGIRLQAQGLDMTRPVTLELAEAPFVRFLDELERALGIVIEVYRVGQDPEDLAVNLITREGAGPRFVAVDDRFRVRIENFTVSESRQWSSAAPATAGRSASLTLKMDAQPGTFASGVLGVSGLRIVDGGGATILETAWQAVSEASEPIEAEDPQAAAFLGRGQDPIRHTQVNLSFAMPETRPERLSQVRGEIVLAFPMTEQESLLSRGRFGESAELAFGRVIVRFEQVEATPTSLGFRLRLQDEAATTQFGYIFSALAFLDDAGTEVPTRGSSASGSRDDTGLTYQLQYQLDGDRVAAIRLRGYAGRYLVRVPFEFRDVPVP